MLEVTARGLERMVDQEAAAVPSEITPDMSIAAEVASVTSRGGTDSVDTNAKGRRSTEDPLPRIRTGATVDAQNIPDTEDPLSTGRIAATVDALRVSSPGHRHAIHAGTRL
jgi:hypothetical protein